MPVRSQKLARYSKSAACDLGPRVPRGCYEMLQRLIRALFDHRIPGCHPRVLPQSRGYLPGSSRAAAAGRRAQTKAGATLTEPPRPLLLDHAAAHMAAIVGCSCHCETGDGGRM